MKRDLSALDRDICQPLGRIIQEAFEDGIACKGSFETTSGNGVTGWLKLPATNVASYVGGALGVFQATGELNGAIFASGAKGIVIDGGTYTEVRHLAAIWADWQLKQEVVAGSTELLYLSNNANNVDNNPDQAIFIYGPNVPIFVNFNNCLLGAMVSTNPTVADYTFTSWRRIQIKIGDDTYCLIADEVTT